MLKTLSNLDLDNNCHSPTGITAVYLVILASYVSLRHRRKRKMRYIVLAAAVLNAEKVGEVET